MGHFESRVEEFGPALACGDENCDGDCVRLQAAKRVVDFSPGCLVGLFSIFAGTFPEVFLDVGIPEDLADCTEKKLAFNGNWNGVSKGLVTL